MNSDRLRSNEVGSAPADRGVGSASSQGDGQHAGQTDGEVETAVAAERASLPPFLRDLLADLGPARVSVADDDRQVYARDLWPRSTLTVAAGLPLADQPQVVVWPDSTAQVAQVVRLCRQHRVPLVPYGAGSGVGGGAVGPAGSLVLDTKSMRAAHIDRAAGTVTCEPGLLGWHLEEQLSRAGLTLGHFPSSIMCSTVGGWVATRGAGQMSSKYGKIEDLVRHVTVVDGRGDILHVDSGDRGGPDLLQCFVGSEGALGILTSMTLSVRPKPAARRLRGFAFPSVEAGCHGIRQMMQHGLRPAVVRLYDEIDTLIAGAGRSHGANPGVSPRLSRVGDVLGAMLGRGGASGQGSFDVEELLRFLRPDAERLRSRVEQWLLRTALGEPGGIQRTVEKALSHLGAECLLIVGFEGDERIVQKEDACAREVLAHCGGRDLGPEPGNRWLAHRYNVSFKMSRVFRAGAFSDTIEVATTWDRLMPLYREVRAAVAPHALIMAHFSHAYIEGCSIYFTIMARRQGSLERSPDERQAALAADHLLYDTIWDAAMRAALRVGAAISHHHGVGRLKTPFLAQDQRDGMRLLALLKQTCDPDNLCNPGNLIDARAVAPDATPAPVAAAMDLPQPPAETFLVRASFDQTLQAIEHSLRAQGRTLGSLPPWALSRRLCEALTQPRPSEASLAASRLRDRVAQVAARLGERAWVVPPQPAPRRATGPDVSQILLGGGAGSTAQLQAVLLRTRPFAPGSWLGWGFSDAAHAAQALCLCRALHGATAFDELVLVSRDIIQRLPGADSALGGAAFALLLQPAAPASLAPEIAAATEGVLGRLSPLAKLPPELCRALWSAEASATWTGPAAPPAHETAVVDAPNALAAALAATAGPRLICGVYLHGAAFVGESLPPARVCLGQTAPPAHDAKPDLGARDAHSSLWPRIQQALLDPSFPRGLS